MCPLGFRKGVESVCSWQKQMLTAELCVNPTAPVDADGQTLAKKPSTETTEWLLLGSSWLEDKSGTIPSGDQTKMSCYAAGAVLARTNTQMTSPASLS